MRTPRMATAVRPDWAPVSLGQDRSEGIRRACSASSSPGAPSGLCVYVQSGHPAGSALCRR
jgi:hypothetical protein